MDTYMAPEELDPEDVPDPYGPDSPLAAMAALCTALGLPLPPIPEALLPLLEQADETVFSTRDDLDSLADMDGLIAEAEAGEILPFTALSHEGYGSNAWYLRYVMALPAAALFVNIPFGGAYMDNDAAAVEIRAAFAAAALLMGKALSASGGKSYVIEHRGLSLSRWCEPGGPWRETADAIADVTALLS